MAFVNEYISQEDKLKYNITEENNFYLAGRSNWTVDRERDMFFLMRVGTGPESPPGITSWAFYWKGHLLDVRLRLIEVGGDFDGGHGWEHDELLEIFDLTPEIESQRSQIISNLKEALTARRGLGVHSSRTSYEVKLDTR